MQSKLICELRSVHRVRQVLLVREDEEEGIAQLVFVEHALKLLAGLRYMFAVVGIDDEGDSFGVLVVFSRR
jgi:hypothetical protein